MKNGDQNIQLNRSIPDTNLLSQKYLGGGCVVSITHLETTMTYLADALGERIYLISARMFETHHCAA